MRVTIKGSADQVADALGMTPVNPRRTGEAKRKREEATARRHLLRSAFDLIRYDPAEKQMVNRLARALGGSEPADEALLKTARWIIANRSQPAH